MSLRSRFRPQSILLEEEFAQEMASALGRLGHALERALAALVAFDLACAQGCAERDPHTRAARAGLVAEAGHALWLLMVQREACGLHDARAALRDYGVPPEVQHCAGAFPPRRG